MDYRTVNHASLNVAGKSLVQFTFGSGTEASQGGRQSTFFSASFVSRCKTRLGGTVSLHESKKLVGVASRLYFVSLAMEHSIRARDG
jgi:hypothetical protein